MTSLEIKTADLNKLILNGNNLIAIDLFYANTVVIQENEEEALIGKENYLIREKDNLKKAKAHTCKLLNQAIDNKKKIVFSEWEIVITNKKNEVLQLREISVQQWKFGKIQKEKFYYQKICPVT
ncbi:MAG: hypothetical protein ABI315_06600 [Bacteroidia bacterium]